MSKTVRIAGSLSLSNGVEPFFSLQMRGTVLVPPAQLAFDYSVVGGTVQITIELPDGETEASLDDLRRIARTTVETGVLTWVIEEGIGVDVRLSQAVYDDGRSTRFVPDQAQQPPSPVDMETVHTLLGTSPLFRWAVRDFNLGLLEREDCPFYFYRSIETLVKAVTGHDRIGKSAWDAFHARLGTSATELETLTEMSKWHRHGTHTEFDEAIHRDMMRVTLRLLRQATEHIQPP